MKLDVHEETMIRKQIEFFKKIMDDGAIYRFTGSNYECGDNICYNVILIKQIDNGYEAKIYVNTRFTGIARDYNGDEMIATITIDKTGITVNEYGNKTYYFRGNGHICIKGINSNITEAQKIGWQGILPYLKEYEIICELPILQYMWEDTGRRVEMEKLEIENKSKDLLTDFALYTHQGGKYYSDSYDIKSISMLICTDLSKDDRIKILEANIRWCYSLSTNKKAEFEYSESGFEQACEWLDEKRLEFIKELL